MSANPSPGVDSLPSISGEQSRGEVSWPDGAGTFRNSRPRNSRETGSYRLSYCVAANDEMRGTLICFSRLRVWAMS
jgi:hypothetical protein